MESSLHYVNREAYLRYIIWRTCFYEDHSAYLPKFHAPIHALYRRYRELSLRFHLAVDEMTPQKFVEEIQRLRESQHIFISCYWDSVPSTKRKRKDRPPKDPIVCCVVHSDWACKYERLLYSSISKGSQEFKIVNGKPVFGEEKFNEDDGITFDAGETLEKDGGGGERVSFRTEEYKETLDWIRKMDEKFGDKFVTRTEDEVVGDDGVVVSPTFDPVHTTPRADEITVVISRKIAQLHTSIEREAIVRQIEAFTYPPLSI